MGKTLKEHLSEIKVFSEIEASYIIEEILNTLYYFEHRNLCHRDLTLDNILYDRNSKKLKIIDFSVSKELKNNNIKMWT